MLIKKSFYCSLLIVTSCLSAGCASHYLDSAEYRYHQKVKQEILIYMDLETMFPDESLRALAKAAGKGQVKKIDQLVAQGVDVNARGHRNATALFWAMNSKRGFMHLLKLGADPNVVFDDGGTVLHWLTKRRQCDLLEMALHNGGDPNLKAGLFNSSLLFSTYGISTKRDEIRCLHELLGNGSDINTVDNSGNTVLIDVITFINYDIAEMFLELGVDPRIKDNVGKTAADYVNETQGRLTPEAEVRRLEFKRKLDKYLLKGK